MMDLPVSAIPIHGQLLEVALRISENVDELLFEVYIFESEAKRLSDISTQTRHFLEFHGS